MKFLDERLEFFPLSFRQPAELDAPAPHFRALGIFGNKIVIGRIAGSGHLEIRYQCQRNVLNTAFLAEQCITFTEISRPVFFLQIVEGEAADADVND
jgi:hypothetical protein